jgi:hypothetical protein
MNKHTQISDKIYALIRAVDLFIWLNNSQNFCQENQDSISQKQINQLLYNQDLAH